MNIKEAIKGDILNNQLPRGVPLRQVELSERYKVSRIPIRDALLSLKAEGWLSPHGKAGVMVPEFRWEEAEDLYLMRSRLECLLFEMAFDHIGETELKAARLILSELNQESLSLIQYGEMNWHFHSVLYQAANRVALHQVVEGLNEKVIRYLGFQYGPLGYRVESEQQHEELLWLIEQNDKQGALIFLQQHIEEAGKLLTEYLKSQSPQ
ncbi:GntR family transcriptional regulator [Marinomonas sp. 2405UD66-6]|uniref:GntR family transcriptional regulator n=1 Tax=Marinomonas sp. 2405UD66-6 TaxID=3391834 RepID=UPI0039C9D1E6